MTVLNFAAAAALVATASAMVFTRDSAANFDASVTKTAKPIVHAWSDLQRDWYKVIGYPLIDNAGGLPGAAKPWSGGAYVTFSLNASMPRESFTITAGKAQTYSYLAVTAADMRGLIFAMYHISGDILGVDPFWWFLDIQPAYAGNVTVPDDYSYASGPPAFYSRGAFFNDEDISGFFFTDAVGDSIYSAHAAERYAETLLRLRANTVIPSTFAYVDERHYRAFQDRGLAFGNHHVMPVGVNTYAWPLGVPYTYRLNPEPLRGLWRDTITYQQVTAGREMFYSLGYRGLNDYPFWQDDTACDTDQCRGQTITWAIANQSAIASTIPVAPGVPAPRFVSYMWMELLELREAGTLVLPPGVACIWTDFPGSFNILGIVNATAGDGFYAHLAMMSGTAGQLTEFIKPARAFANMWAFYMKNATSYGMINVSDLKHIPLTAEAVYKYMWNPLAFNATHAGCPVQRGTAVTTEAKSGSRRTGPRGPVGWWPMPEGLSHDGRSIEGCDLTVTPAQAQATFTLDFTTRHYGTPSNSTALPQAIADVHTSYFNVSYMNIDEDCTTIDSCNLGDHYLGSTLRALIAPFQTAVDGNQHNASLAQAAAPLLAFAATNLPYMSSLYLDRVVPIAAYVAPGQQANMYAEHVTMQVGLHYWHLMAFQQLGNAAVAWSQGNTAAADAGVAAALASIDACLDVMRAGEGPATWRGVYAQEYWTWVIGSRAQLAHLLAHIRDSYIPEPPASIYPDYAFMTYECPLHDSLACNTFPFSAFNGSIAWDVMVRVTCQQDAPHDEAEAARIGGQTAMAMVNQARGLRAKAAIPATTAVTSAASCTTGVMGVSYTGPSTNVALFTAFSPARGAAPRPSIRYTLDGSPVGPASTLYTAPFPVAGNATVRAQAFDGATGVALVTESLALVTQTSPTATLA